VPFSVHHVERNLTVARPKTIDIHWTAGIFQDCSERDGHLRACDRGRLAKPEREILA
jgi:hypothetical protein